MTKNKRVCKINKDGLFVIYNDNGSTSICGELFGAIISVSRQSLDNGENIATDLCVELETEVYGALTLRLKYTSIEARMLMNILDNLNDDVGCGKDLRIILLRDTDYVEKTYREIRIERNGKRVMWKHSDYPKTQGTNYKERDEYWDKVYENVEGTWCDLSTN